MLVRNPQPEDITIASVTVDDAIVPFTLDGPRTVGRLRSTTIESPSTGSRTTRTPSASPARPASRRWPTCPPPSRRPGRAAPASPATPSSGCWSGSCRSRSGCCGCRALRQADARWLTAFMALTAGLLTFLAFEALAEALELQAGLPSALGGTGLVMLGVAVSFLGLSWVAQRLAARDPGSAGDGTLAGLALATMVAVGIGAPQPRRGTRDRLVVRPRRARARHVPDRRLHGAQRHRGPRHRGADRRRGPRRASGGSPRWP